MILKIICHFFGGKIKGTVDVTFVVTNICRWRNVKFQWDFDVYPSLLIQVPKFPEFSLFSNTSGGHRPQANSAAQKLTVSAIWEENGANVLCTEAVGI